MRIPITGPMTQVLTLLLRYIQQDSPLVKYGLASTLGTRQMLVDHRVIYV